MDLKKYLEFSDEVKIALKNNKPIVALESTIISHGMPYPDNVKTASEVEEIIRNNGVTPATIGIIEGKIKIGLSKEELDFFGSAKGVYKVSRRDIPYVIANKKNGATTVAGTMIFAEMAGIKVFVTGGLGGVHRGVEKTWDISADLYELMKTNVAVVCAGVKSILDISKTLECLETFGVPVIGYNTEDFPAFYTKKSGYSVLYNLKTPNEIADFIKTKYMLNLNGGVVIGNPIPDEYSMDEKLINESIENALTECENLKITGKDITPFLLAKIKHITDGKSLEANIALIKNNANLGAKIAKNL
ncbi:MAG: pseudouridine-5'-phosphate glycosidase [Candidatus Sericytochromatia bacterium]